MEDGSGVKFSPIINGCWTLAGGHGREVLDKAKEILENCADNGFNTFDTADIYGQSQTILGRFKKDYETRKQQQNQIQIFSKFCPQFQGNISKAVVKDYIQKKILDQLQVSSIDLLQFHWWDYEDAGLIDTAKYLMELREEGLFKSLGLTNIDCEHLQQMLDAGIKISSNQIQFSLIDRRPHNGMLQLCQDNDIKILSFGSVGGGLLSDTFAPKVKDSDKAKASILGTLFSSKQIDTDLNTVSRKMYWNIIKMNGGKEFHDRLLEVLTIVASRNQKTIAQVALRWVIQQGRPNTIVPIVGIRNNNHLKSNAEILNFSLAQNDMNQIQEVLKLSKGGPKGDIWSHERST